MPFRNTTRLLADLLFVAATTIVLPLLLLNHVATVLTTWPLPPA